jgi:two-component system response regulator CpxR
MSAISRIEFRFLAAMKRILVIDDDVSLTELLAEYLHPEKLELSSARTGERGLLQALSGEFDLIVLDVMLPGISGFEVLRRIREQSEIPVLLLTTRRAAEDRIAGLRGGADDYLAKPFHPDELVARIQAILRRASPKPVRGMSDVFTIDDLEMRTKSRAVLVRGDPVPLTSTEYDVLKILLASAGNVVLREDLCREALGRVFSPYDRSVDNLISNIRKKLGPLSNGLERIKSIRAAGYLYAVSGELENRRG